jgi:hypothetical protein
VHIAYAPKDREELEKLKTKVWDLFGAAKIEIGTFGTPGDMGCDYGWGSKIHLDFDQCRDVFNEGEPVRTCNGQCATVLERNHRTGGDWYKIKLVDGTVIDEYYKGDLSHASSDAAFYNSVQN